MHPLMDVGRSAVSFVSPGSVVKRSVYSPYQLFWAGAGDCFPHLEEIPDCVMHVLTQMDSTTVMHYLNRAGQTRSRSRDTKIWVMYSVVSGVDRSDCSPYFGPDNILGALTLSSSTQESLLERSTDFSLDLRVTYTGTYLPTVWHSVEQQGWGFLPPPPPPDTFTLPGNFLQVDWSKGLLYMYSPCPFCLLLFTRWFGGEAQFIEILPWWPRRGWFPLVLQLLMKLPVF